MKDIYVCLPRAIWR